MIVNARFVKGDISTKFLSDVYPDGFKGMYIYVCAELFSSQEFIELCQAIFILIATHSVSVMNKGSLTSLLLSVLALCVILTINIHDFDCAWVIHKCNPLQLFSSKTNKQTKSCVCSFCSCVRV